MKTRSLALLLVLVLTWIAAGCTSAPATPEAALQRFLQSRAAGDANAMHSLLTGRARKAITPADVAHHIRSETFTFGALGAPVSMTETRVQVTVRDYRIASGATTVTWPEFRVTLMFEEERWRVAWTEPLAARAQQAYANSQFGEELDLARAIDQIDPYSYRGPLERHFAFRGLKRLREAEAELVRARDLASPYELPAVEDAFARFKLSLNQPADAAALARSALEHSAPLVPGLYSHRWQADTLTVLGRAHWAQGDGAAAEETLVQAEHVDPGNAAAAMLRRELVGGWWPPGGRP